MFTYNCNSPAFKRKNKPDAWIKVADIDKSKMFVSYPFFASIPVEAEPVVRYGDFVIDIDTQKNACLDAIKIIDWMENIYGIEASQWRVFLSGKKGVHLELSSAVMGLESGSIYLPLAYKRLALELQGELDITLDLSMYNMGTGKPYRQPNVKRKNGNYKRQIKYSDLAEIDRPGEYINACNQPGKLWSEKPQKAVMLSEKIQHYLTEAKTATENILAVPALTDEQIDRLHFDTPPCVAMMANSVEFSKTYNEVAMQITAYAVSARMSETDFMALAAVFIALYPSTSLKTQANRERNCRDRYRSMTANNNTFSCAGVKSLQIAGLDCSKCNHVFEKPKKIPPKKIKKEEPRTETKIPPLDGLLAEGMAALKWEGCIGQYALCTIMTAIAGVIAGKITLDDIWPNLYNIKIGGTSTGKTYSDKKLRKAIYKNGDPLLNTLYGPTALSAGQAIYRALQAQPYSVFVFDELTAFFKKMSNGKAEPNSQSQKEALLSIWSDSGGPIFKQYSNNQDTIKIDQACLTISGNTTPLFFDNIDSDDFLSGLVQRLEFYCYDGKIKDYEQRIGEENHKLREFVEKLAVLINTQHPGDLSSLTPYELKVTPEAKIILLQHSKESVRKANLGLESDGSKGIIGRSYEVGLKYAIIHHVSTRDDIYSDLNSQSMQWGVDYAQQMADWKVHVLSNRITTGHFHKDCEILKRAIQSAEKTGKTPTFGVLCGRAKVMKNWDKTYLYRVVDVLEIRKEIVVDRTGGNLVLYSVSITP